MTINKIDDGLSVLFHMFVLIMFFIPTVIYGIFWYFKIHRVLVKNVRQSNLNDWSCQRHVPKEKKLF